MLPMQTNRQGCAAPSQGALILPVVESQPGCSGEEVNPLGRLTRKESWEHHRCLIKGSGFGER